MPNISPSMQAMSKQYRRGTTGDSKIRWNNFKSSSRQFNSKESCMKEHLCRHFHSKVNNTLVIIKCEK